ncbi:hypothetical protein [Neorhodopirellula lusitana]|nr:hypothetical protein [Neorhodopirellula lusitana]
MRKIVRTLQERLPGLRGRMPRSVGRRILADIVWVRLCSGLLVVAGSLCWIMIASATDRTSCFLPVPSLVDSVDEEPAEETLGALPTEALGITATSLAGDLDWWRYMQVWKSVATGEQAPRRWLGLPLEEETLISVRRGRSSPRFLRWKSGSFVVVQTPHFEILSRCDDATSRRAARDVERLYWVWTQMYFPLWSGRDSVGVSLGEWGPDVSGVAEFLNRNSGSRLTSSARHRIVLLPDVDAYRQTVASPSVAAGAAVSIAQSEGFYSDVLRTSFFYPQGDSASLAHEVTHQLFEEATDRPRRAKASSQTDDFWLVEGIAGHFESFHAMADQASLDQASLRRASVGRASVGGWDSARLQYARYQALIARQPIATIADLRGKRDAVQRHGSLAAWYSQSILRVHFEMDSGFVVRRAELMRRLAAIYSVNVKDFASLEKRSPDQESEATEPDRVDRFLMVNDEMIARYPVRANATALCLAGCEVSQKGWSAVGRLPHLTWLDGSRTPIGDTDVERILDGAVGVEQLSLEATGISPGVGQVIAAQANLRELDLSWTQVDDALIGRLSACPKIETLWLTGCPITDQSIETLEGLSRLKTIDLQRTEVTSQGRQRLREANPGLVLDPLQLQ